MLMPSFDQNVRPCSQTACSHGLKKMCNLPKQTCNEHLRLLSFPLIVWIRGSCVESEREKKSFFPPPITLQFKFHPSCSSRALESRSQGQFLTKAELSGERPPCRGSHLNQLHALFAPAENQYVEFSSFRERCVHA